MVASATSYVKSIKLGLAIDMMDTTRVDLNLLVTLEALLAERNVTKAASRLHLSQPAVSAQLSRLRDVFDDPLFVPSHRGMTPTAKALELIEPLRQALEQVRLTLQTHRDFDPARARLTITIACSDYIQTALIGPLLLSLREKAPGLRLAIHHLNPALLEQHLVNGDIDLAIAAPNPSQSHLRSAHLFDDTYVLIGRRNHPSLRRDITVKEYAALDHVVVSRIGGGFRTPTDDALAALGHKRRVVLSASSFLFIPEIVATSDLVALVPRRLLRSNLDRLTVIDTLQLVEPLKIDLFWHERTHGHAGHRWIREAICSLARTGPRKVARAGSARLSRQSRRAK